MCLRVYEMRERRRGDVSELFTARSGVPEWPLKMTIAYTPLLSATQHKVIHPGARMHLIRRLAFKLPVRVRMCLLSLKDGIISVSAEALFSVLAYVTHTLATQAEKC